MRTCAEWIRLLRGQLGAVRLLEVSPDQYTREATSIGHPDVLWRYQGVWKQKDVDGTSIQYEERYRDVRELGELFSDSTSGDSGDDACDGETAKERVVGGSVVSVNASCCC